MGTLNFGDCFDVDAFGLSSFCSLVGAFLVLTCVGLVGVLLTDAFLSALICFFLLFSGVFRF